MSEWIPCSERLPEKDGRYIILDCDECASDDVFVTSDYGGHDWISHGNDVIAWMPFPEISEEIEKIICGDQHE